MKSSNVSDRKVEDFREDGRAPFDGSRRQALLHGEGKLMEQFTVQLAPLVMVCVGACNALTSVWDRKDIGVTAAWAAFTVLAYASAYYTQVMY